MFAILPLIYKSLNMECEQVDHVGVYVYLHEVDEQKVICSDDQPWAKSDKAGSFKSKNTRSTKDDLVWYVAYGSNLLEERFLCYINGGKFRDCGRELEKCLDLSPVRAKMLYELPFDMYYGKQSGSWDGMGVSFLDVTKKGKAYGIAYLISKEQYEHLCKEENGGKAPEYSSWYNQRFNLGTFDGIPVVTLTNKGVVKKNLPSPRYMEVLTEGLRENYTYLSEEEISVYIQSRNS